MKAVYTLVNSNGKPGNYVDAAHSILSHMSHIISEDDYAYEFCHLGRDTLPTGLRIMPNAETQLEFLSSSRDGVENAERRLLEARKEVSVCFAQEGLRLT